LDLQFLPKDLLYNQKNYTESNKNLLAAIDILEKAQTQQNKPKVEEEDDPSFWSKVGTWLNPFKCGKND
jgi:hypothetical protein